MSRVADMIGQRRARLTASVASDGPSSPACRASGLLQAPASADTLRLAVFHTDLSRAGPGLLLRDIVAGDDPQVRHAAVIAAAEADVLLLLDMDHDAGPCRADRPGRGARRARCALSPPFRRAPNTGRPTGVDLDGDGRSWRARDAHGYGLFSGDGGMAILSRFRSVRCATSLALPWVDLPEQRGQAVTPARGARGAPPAHSVAAWDVELLTPAGAFHILASHASPPVFDGPEDRNGLRNATSCGSGALSRRLVARGAALRRRPLSP
jgi:hypothetical protein